MLKDDRSTSTSIPSENNLVIISNTNSCISQIVQDVENNERTIENEDDKRIMNRSFIDHPLWYEEKLTHHTELLPLSKYTNSTKRILAWSENWNNLPEYDITITQFKINHLTSLLTALSAMIGKIGSVSTAAQSGSAKWFLGMKMVKI